MNIEIHETGLGPHYVVTLSARNLRTLQGLYAMALEGEAIPSIVRHTTNGDLTVLIEPDLHHYGDRIPGSTYTIKEALERDEAEQRD